MTRPKPAHRSRTMHLAALMVLTALIDAMAAGLGWRQALLAALGALVAVLRLVTREPVALRPRRRPPPLGVLLLLLGGCGAAWPDACRVEDADGQRELVCRGSRAVVFAEGTRPGGTVGVELDGQRLPLRIVGERVTLPVAP